MRGSDPQLWPCFQAILAVGHAEEHRGFADRHRLCVRVLDVE